MISFLPGLKSAGGTEEILRNTIGERVLGLPPEPRLDKGIPFSELRGQGEGRGRGHEPDLSDEQEFLREAARGRARRASRPSRPPARRSRTRPPCRTCGRSRSRPAGPACSSPRSTAAPGSAPTTRCSSRRSAAACSPASAARPAPGHRAARRRRHSDRGVAAGELRAAWLPARPPSVRRGPGWTVDPRRRMAASAAPRATVDGDEVTFTGAVAWVPDAPGRRRARRHRRDRRRRGGRGGVEAGATASVERTWRYDATRAPRPRDARRRARGAARRRRRATSRGPGTSRRR